MKRNEIAPPDAAVIPGASPDIAPRVVSDPLVIEQGRAYHEAHRQMTPLAGAGTPEAKQASRFFERFTARPRGLSSAAAYDMVTREGDVSSLLAGANPEGKVKEIIAALELKGQTRGDAGRIVNAAKQAPGNVRDVRLSPDNACTRDLVFVVGPEDGPIFVVPGGQVKTGSGKYLADSLTKMATKANYGKTAYVDARFVNPDGSPRVAADAFTPGQAQKLRAAGVKLRGILDLDARGAALEDALRRGARDGLDPLAREQQRALRSEIARAYSAGGVASRVGTGLAMGAAMGLVMALLVQLIASGEVDPTQLCLASARAGAIGAGGVLADAGVYHLAVKAGLVPEAAKSVAANTVAIGFALVSIAFDVVSELRALRSGEISVAGAISGTLAKVALDLLPIALAPLGLLAVPIVIVAQIGGRWLLARRREGDRKLQAEIQADLDARHRLHQRLDAAREATADVLKTCAETDDLFAQVMGPSATVTNHNSN